MLTRIEIDGFKSFRRFELDVPPFLVVLGRNASGKSNLFDAIQFLRLLAGGTLVEAGQHMRGDMAELFHRHVDGSRLDRMSFAVEALVPPVVSDAFGDRAEIDHTRLRYEVTIELRAASRGDRPFVVDEAVRLITMRSDTWVERLPHGIRSEVALYGRRGTQPLETKTSAGGRPVFALHAGDAHFRQLPAAEATATVLSTLATASEFPLLFAMKRELQSWRLLHPNPACLRMPSSFDDPDELAEDGSNLPNMLRRISDETATPDRPRGILPDIVADLAAVIPGVRDIRIAEDDARRQRQLEVLMRGEAAYSARLASDGTLRALALLAALHDPRDSGLVCVEEPENGLYPGRLVSFLRRLRRSVRPTAVPASLEQRMRQLVLSSHSPAVLRAVTPITRANVRDDVVSIHSVTSIDKQRRRSRISRVRRISADRPAAERVDGEATPRSELVGAAEIAEFEVREALER